MVLYSKSWIKTILIEIKTKTVPVCGIRHNYSALWNSACKQIATMFDNCWSLEKYRHSNSSILSIVFFIVCQYALFVNPYGFLCLKTTKWLIYILFISQSRYQICVSFKFWTFFRMWEKLTFVNIGLTVWWVTIVHWSQSNVIVGLWNDSFANFRWK